MYSSSIILVITIGKGVYGFTLDPSIGEFMLSHNDIKVMLLPNRKATGCSRGIYAN